MDKNKTPGLLVQVDGPDRENPGCTPRPWGARKATGGGTNEQDEQRKEENEEWRGRVQNQARSDGRLQGGWRVMKEVS